ncbi:hypothetical protein EDI28_21585 [Photobacterium chitinilyticum]|uniref:Uncharacterized protein n=2 Tax=Photobacterium chitinilyticum TaxID=2485123 RepID=A0A3S3RYJ4_9GAMM|nr:hypothetical protein EDI28_21585 [Photobacterium chitinilyticum]
MEEVLRHYLQQNGYYVVRGVPFKYKGFDVTDIDLWLYARTSSMSREISIVDIKNKKTPQAIERIFWIKGLKDCIGADKAIIATTDRRKEVTDFGKSHGVFVLDGDFLSRLRNKENSDRLTDEEFDLLFKNYKFEKLNGDWKNRISKSKALLLDGLGFNSSLSWLEQAAFFSEQVFIGTKHTDLSARCFYLLCSFIAIAVDYILKDYAFLTVDLRTKRLAEGFTFGDKGTEAFDNNLKNATKLISAYHDNGKAISAKIQKAIDEQLSSLDSGSLAVFFSKPDVAKNLFIVANELEALAYNNNFVTHTEKSLEVRAFIGCILDYLGHDRVKFNQALSPHSKSSKNIQKEMPI